MATTSFKKEFVVRDKDVADRLKKDVEGDEATVSYSRKDTDSEKKKAESLLARLASA